MTKDESVTPGDIALLVFFVIALVFIPFMIVDTEVESELCRDEDEIFYFTNNHHGIRHESLYFTDYSCLEWSNGDTCLETPLQLSFYEPVHLIQKNQPTINNRNACRVPAPDGIATLALILLGAAFLFALRRSR